MFRCEGVAANSASRMKQARQRNRTIRSVLHRVVDNTHTTSPQYNDYLKTSDRKTVDLHTANTGRFSRIAVDSIMARHASS